MVIDSFFPVVGGSETAVRRLSDTLVDLGHTVGVAVLSRPDAANPSTKFSFWKVPSTLLGIDAKFVGKIVHLRRIIRSFRPDVVNVHFMLESGYVGVRSARAEHIPVVLTNRGRGLYNEPTNGAERLLYPFWNRGSMRADAFIATSQEMVDLAKERYGVDSLAISNGVDIEHFHPSRDGRSVRKRYAVPSGRRVLLCVRRLVPKNGIEYIVRALPLLSPSLDVELWLAAPKNREYEKLVALALELGVQDRVRFLGSVDHAELPMYLAAADVVVQPSIAEARSLACLEAMANGAAVIATATGGLKEIITHGENGFLIAPFQESTYAVTTFFQDGVRRVADAVKTVLTDEALRARMQKGARAYAETCSWPQIARQTLAVYEKAIQSRSRS